MRLARDPRSTSQRTPLTSSRAAVGVSSAGRGSPQRSTTGRGTAAQARTPGGRVDQRAGAQRAGSAASSAGSAASSAVQPGSVADGASTGTSASGLVVGSRRAADPAQPGRHGRAGQGEREQQGQRDRDQHRGVRPLAHRAGHQVRCTTGQVSVRVIPLTPWTWATTS